MVTSPKPRVLSEIKACLNLALPLAGAQFAQSSISFVDTMMMGWLGSQTIAAGGLGSVIFSTLLITGTSIVSAVSPLTAEAHGAKNLNRIQIIFGQGLWLSVWLSIPIMVLIWHSSSILDWLGQPAEVIESAEIYLKAIVWGYFPGLGFAVLRHYIAALSQLRPIIVVILGGVVLNIAGNYILAFGKFGMPALGLAGIGWASTLSFWITFVALAAYIVVHPNLRTYRGLKALHPLRVSILGELLHIGLPIGILALVEIGLFAVTSFLMGRLGTVTLAAHQIALQTAALTYTIPLGLSLAATIRVGQLKGQGNHQAARMSGYVAVGMGAIVMAGMGLVMWTMPGQIVALYLDVRNPANEEVVALAKTLLGVAAVFQIFDGIQVTTNGVLRGLKDTYIPMIIGIVSYWGIGLTSGYMLGLRLGWGGVGLWCGLAIGLAVAAGVLVWRFRSSRVQPPTKAQLARFP